MARGDFLRRAAAAFSRPPLWMTLVVCATIAICRRPEIITTPQFWAEDSIIFFADAYNHGLKALLAPYAGYLHTIPRAIAALAVATDPVKAPAIFMGSALLLTLYVAARTQSERAGFPRHSAFALAVVLVPDTYEVFLLLVNVQWVLAAGLLLLLISRDPQSRIQWAHDIGAALVLGLTGPFSILFAPLFLWRGIVRRTRGSVGVTAAVLLAAIVQIVTIVLNPVVMLGDRIVPFEALPVPGMRIAASLFIGCLASLDFRPVIAIALTVVTAIGIVVLVRRNGEHRLERLWLGVGLAALLAGTLYRCRYVLPDLDTAGFGARYFFPQQLITLWLLLMAGWDNRRAVAAVAVALSLWSVAVNGPRLRENPLPDLNWPGHAEKLRRGEAAEIPVNPGWTLTLRAK